MPSQGRDEKIWKLMDNLELFGNERTKAEPMIREFQNLTEKEEEARIKRLIKKVWLNENTLPEGY